MLPGLSSTYYRIFDGGVHTDIIASIAPTGTKKETERAKRRGRPYSMLTAGQSIWCTSNIAYSGGPFIVRVCAR